MDKLRERAAHFLLPAVELVLEVKPAFYSATDDSLPYRRFVCSWNSFHQIQWEEITRAQDR